MPIFIRCGQKERLDSNRIALKKWLLFYNPLTPLQDEKDELSSHQKS